MNDLRSEQLSEFVKGSDWRGSRIEPLAGDASTRRYLRLIKDDRTAIVMDAPNPDENLYPFVAMTDWLRSHGYSAPEIFAADHDRRFLLLEDLGPDLFASWLLRRPTDEEKLYRSAVDLLVDLADQPVPATVGKAPARTTVESYGLDALQREADLLLDWWMPAASGVRTVSDLTMEFQELIKVAWMEIRGPERVMVMRDYHAENLIWLPNRPGLAAVGLLDYQDFLLGHPAYDLVSLLEDARRDTDIALQRAMLDQYVMARPSEGADLFRAAYAFYGAQRNAKIIGIFTRLAVRDGKRRYVEMIPRVWQHLMNDLRHPTLAALRMWIERNVPEPTPGTLAMVGSQGAA